MAGDETSLTNGHDKEPDEFALFKIGGRELKVGALTLWDLEQSKDDLQGMDPDTPWTTYATKVVRIVARKLAAGDDGARWQALEESLLKACTAREARGLAAAFNELWRISGLMSDDPTPGDAALGEAEAAATAQSGTGTSIESPPNSP